MPVVVTINLPANGAQLQVGANYQLVGTIQTSSPDGPTPIDNITAQGPGLGPVQLIAQGQGRYRFTAQGKPNVAGIFPITVRAVDDRGAPGSRGITVSVGFMYSPVAPDILVDINPGTTISTLFNSLIGPKLQSGVTPLSRLLPAPLTLVGPEQRLSGPTARIGFWILEPGRTNLTPPLFQVISANPPASPLPRLPTSAVAASFRLLPNPTVAAPSGSTPVGPFGFDISVSVGALQKLADALLPQVRAEFAGMGASVESIVVTCTPPNMVVTVVRGSFNGVRLAITITEVLGIVLAVGPPAGQLVPSITGTAGVDVGLPGWSRLLSGIAGVLGFATLFAITGIVEREAEINANNVVSLANASISGIPEIIPFKSRPVALLGIPFLFGGLFPAAIPSWTSLGATAAGIVGTGTFDVRPRTVSDIALALSGPTTLLQTEPNTVQGRYTVSWRGIIPDPGTFLLTVSGRRGVVLQTIVIPITNEGQSRLVIDFPIPIRLGASGETFSLAVTATETSEGDGVTTLVAPPARLRVVVRPRRGRTR